MEFYTIPIQEALEKFETNQHIGLSATQAKQVLNKYGENKLEKKKHLNPFQKFLLQLKDYMVIILITAAVISFVIALLEPHGEFIDSVIIISIVILNAILGVIQESRAEVALDALQNMSAPTVKVIRDGKTSVISSAEVVPGDIVILESGDLIPADGRIIEAASLKCEESALTGESVPVDKDVYAIVEKTAPIGDRLNMVYSGCTVAYGRATVLITATGMKTEIGKIAGLLSKEKTETTPLQVRLNQMGKYLGLLAIVVCAIIFALGIFQGFHPTEMFMTSVSLAVAAIPEGLTAVVTVVLAMGVQKMVKRNAIIRRLPAVETLGSTSVICSDKTGTLTQNRMTVVKLWDKNGEIVNMSANIPQETIDLLKFATLCNDGRIEKVDDREEHIGDPTETSIVSAAYVVNLDKIALESECKRVAEIPFDSDRKLMTTVNIINGKYTVVVKGGFDVLLPLCVNADTEKAENANLIMAQDALRVLAVAYKEIDEMPQEITPAELEQGLTFAGLIGMIDPPREESKEAIAMCKKAGIKTVMITGDHVTTASAIARDLGILSSASEAISGQELQKISDDELTANVTNYSVYARVSPEDKIRIVKAWKANGAIVAMTGDGVNDAPALKAADIGCAMGITGTDVAKGAADMVLVDDNFSTIVSAVESGRGIFENIKKTVQFLLGSNIGEVLVVFFAMIIGWGMPLLAIHLLLINTITDALPALALGVEPVDRNIMNRKPIPKEQGIFANGLGIAVVLQGIMIGIITLTAYYIGSFVDISGAFIHSHEIGMTMAFLTLSLSQLVQAYNCRSASSLFKVGILSNFSMNKAFLVSLAVIILICVIPQVSAIFKVAGISYLHWFTVILLSIAPLFITEVVKLVIVRD